MTADLRGTAGCRWVASGLLVGTDYACPSTALKFQQEATESLLNHQDRTGASQETLCSSRRQGLSAICLYLRRPRDVGRGAAGAPPCGFGSRDSPSLESLLSRERAAVSVPLWPCRLSRGGGQGDPRRTALKGCGRLPSRRSARRRRCRAGVARAPVLLDHVCFCVNLPSTPKIREQHGLVRRCGGADVVGGSPGTHGERPAVQGQARRGPPRNVDRDNRRSRKGRAERSRPAAPGATRRGPRTPTANSPSRCRAGCRTSGCTGPSR